MKTNKLFVLVLLIIGAVACASIPKESVTLSEEIAIGLKKQHNAQISLVNLNFTEKRNSLDKAMISTLNNYFDILTPNGSITLTKNQLNDIAQDIIVLNNKNNIAKEELEKVRILIVEKINKNYFSLFKANSSLTNLLKSVVSVKEGQSEVFGSLSKLMSENLDLEEIFSELDSFVIKGGIESGKAIKLINKLKTQFRKLETQQE